MKDGKNQFRMGIMKKLSSYLREINKIIYTRIFLFSEMEISNITLEFLSLKLVLIQKFSSRLGLENSVRIRRASVVVFFLSIYLKYLMRRNITPVHSHVLLSGLSFALVIVLILKFFFPL